MITSNVNLAFFHLLINCVLFSDQTKLDVLRLTLTNEYSSTFIYASRNLLRSWKFFHRPLGKPVQHAIITHAHSDHARWGHRNYLAHTDSVPVLKLRLGDIHVQGIPYNQSLIQNGVKVSLHPAGHIIGSAQVRVEHKGEVWCVSGDYKTEHDPVAVDFEPVKCHTFITECTFGLPVYQWPEEKVVIREVEEWWRGNQREGKVSLLSAYALGKAQRILSLIDASIGPIFCHGAVDNLNKVHVQLGVLQGHFPYLSPDISKEELMGALVIAPPSTLGSSWAKKLGQVSEGMLSGWMMLRGSKRRRNVDRGFVFSDHADWNGLNHAVRATQAENVICTHGYADTYSRWLGDNGYNAFSERALFENEINPDADL